jgi:hypothetical protein
VNVGLVKFTGPKSPALLLYDLFQIEGGQTHLQRKYGGYIDETGKVNHFEGQASDIGSTK